MKTKLLLMLFLVIISGQLVAQDYKIDFALLNSSEFPDSVLVTNLDQNTNLTLQGDEVLHLVKTLLTNDLQIYPNPMRQSTNIEFYNPKKGVVNISIIDLEGRKILQKSEILSAGNCIYKLSGLGMGTYIVNISTNSLNLFSIVLSTETALQSPGIELVDIKEQYKRLKLSLSLSLKNLHHLINQRKFRCNIMKEKG